METDTFVAWVTDPKAAGLSLTKPFNGQPATVGNGVMVALDAPNPAEVDRLHALALSLGGTDEGAPGLRGGGFYCGYFRDPDGNKLNFFCFTGG
jgi:predicted lactoylglutathione lyase